MTVAVVGAGAVGMTIGAAFAAAGHEVIACSKRAPREAAISIDDGTGERRYPVRWLTEPPGSRSAAPRADWIVLATKIHQTGGAAVAGCPRRGGTPGSSPRRTAWITATACA